MFNSKIQGWMNYYTFFYKSEFFEVLRYINSALIKWTRRKYKKKNSRRKAERWLGEIAKRDRRIFAHWKIGILPSAG
jgi:RNA-directed DNA polymerase